LISWFLPRKFDYYRSGFGLNGAVEAGDVELSPGFVFVGLVYDQDYEGICRTHRDHTGLCPHS